MSCRLRPTLGRGMEVYRSLGRGMAAGKPGRWATRAARTGAAGRAVVSGRARCMPAELALGAAGHQPGPIGPAPAVAGRGCWPRPAPGLGAASGAGRPPARTRAVGRQPAAGADICGCWARRRCRPVPRPDPIGRGHVRRRRASRASARPRRRGTTPARRGVARSSLRREPGPGSGRRLGAGGAVRRWLGARIGAGGRARGAVAAARRPGAVRRARAGRGPASVAGWRAGAGAGAPAGAPAAARRPAVRPGPGSQAGRQGGTSSAPVPAAAPRERDGRRPWPRVPLETPRALPAALHPMASAITGRARPPLFTTGPATRHALAAAGALGATTGTVVHLPSAPGAVRLGGAGPRADPHAQSGAAAAVLPRRGVLRCSTTTRDRRWRPGALQSASAGAGRQAADGLIGGRQAADG